MKILSAFLGLFGWRPSPPVIPEPGSLWVRDDKWALPPRIIHRVDASNLMRVRFYMPGDPFGRYAADPDGPLVTDGPSVTLNRVLFLQRFRPLQPEDKCYE